jgi:hypothetical protein
MSKKMPLLWLCGNKENGGRIRGSTIPLPQLWQEFPKRKKACPLESRALGWLRISAQNNPIIGERAEAFR